MPSERVQRTIDQLLDSAELAVTAGDWAQVQALCERLLTIDPDNVDARSFRAVAERGLAAPSKEERAAPTPRIAAPIPPTPSSFASGRYTVSKFLGEGGKKKVYLAHDTLLDRDVAFALIKMEGLYDAGRDRIKREAQAMGRLGSQPHIVSVFDMGRKAGSRSSSRS